MKLVIAGTGHRPPRLGLDYSDSSRALLVNFIRNQLEKMEKKPDKVISGMANGFDQALAESAFILSIPFIAAVPFNSQHSKWPQDAQKVYLNLLGKAEKVHIVCPGGYANWKFYERDKWMCDNASLLIALCDNKPEKSGTKTTIEYANKIGLKVANCWSDWEKYREN